MMTQYSEYSFHCQAVTSEPTGEMRADPLKIPKVSLATMPGIIHVYIDVLTSR
jgi:hypothetical protein